MTILPNPRPIHELAGIFQWTTLMRQYRTDDQVRQITGFSPAGTFERFLAINGQPVFEEVLR
ncbi:hypothetical protein B4O97_03625 [Marispirochaeta aestuarii]|uniref:Uncharacterized protein n=1 Tax=Marispirochaeta aestuarii TaxID=1963862 RepID=A0A1Y1S1A9_9SPIO|nr:hypothetical protein [Marispirochaeta aestuarii]ORC37292.1 hypothetical protein B4O97_03625 [Marispirochaeta aestuarii]